MSVCPDHRAQAYAFAYAQARAEGFGDTEERRRVDIPRFGSDQNLLGITDKRWRNRPYRIGAKSFTRGTVAMANSAAPASNGSQFFIVNGDIESLGDEYSVFGTVVSGLGIVDRVAADGTADGGKDGRPKRKITIGEITGRT